MAPDQQPELSQKQQLAIIRLASGESITDVAKAVKVRRETIHEWRRQECFKKGLEEAQAAIWNEGIGSVLSGFKRAADALLTIAEDSSINSSDRIKAAGMLLKAGIDGYLSVKVQLQHEYVKEEFERLKREDEDENCLPTH